MLLQGILKERSSGPMDQEAARALPHYFLTGLASHKEQGCCLAKPNLLPSPSLICLLHDRPMNLREEVLRQGICFYSESQMTKEIPE